MNQPPRRPVREMSQRRRHQGLSQLELHQIQVGLLQITKLITQAAVVPIGALRAFVLLIAKLLLQGVLAMTSGIYRALDPVNPVNKNRLIASYTDEQCWYLFRLRKDQLIDLFARLNLPANITCDNDIICPAEHALRSSYPAFSLSMSRVLIYWISLWPRTSRLALCAPLPLCSLAPCSYYRLSTIVFRKLYVIVLSTVVFISYTEFLDSIN